MVLSSHTASLFWFRMDMMIDFRNSGYEVIAVGPGKGSEWRDQFKDYGIRYQQLHVERNGLNPGKDIRTFMELYRMIKEEKPNKIFAYQAKTVIYGCIAARANGIREVYSLIAGLGSIFRGTGLKNKIIKRIMKTEYRIACKYVRKAFFQNSNDRYEFVYNGLVEEGKTVLINGSGVNLQKFAPTPIPNEPTFLFIGRLIKDKGIAEYLEACKILKKNNSKIRCLLVGPYDSNPSALRPQELQPFIHDGIVEYYGEQKDVRPYISQCTTYVLPSYHEGTPKTVLEAMAMGRAIITSNAPGCRETVLDGINGYLVAVKDIEGLAKKMLYLAKNPDLNRKMGAYSLKLAVEKYDVKKVNQMIMHIMGLTSIKCKVGR